jgi:rifampicin phosphotransferase
MTPMILPLPTDLAEDALRRSLGGKGASLQRLIGMGLPVPPAVVVPAEVFCLHVAGLGMGEVGASLDDGRAPARPQRLSQLRAAIEAAPLPAELLAALRGVPALIGPGPYAVRSSATVEDSAASSCAGQFETVLDVGEARLAEAVRQVWASLWSERAAAYRAARQRGADSPAMAVVIQRQIAAEVSGVLFTCDPVRGDQGRMVLEAVRGLGDALVSGAVTPDRWTVSKEPLDIVDCVFAGGPEGAGVSHESPARAAAGGILEEAMVLELCRMGLGIERRQGCPQDIEWAIAGGTVHLLQSRPVTTGPAAKAPAPEDRQVWTNVNVAEVMPDVVTPMTWSVMEPLATCLLGHYFSKLGIDLAGHRLFGHVGGRAYFNLNTLVACTRRIPGMRGKGMTQIFGGHQDAAAQSGQIKLENMDIPQFKLSLLCVAIRIPRLLLEVLTFSPKKGQAVFGRIRRTIDDEAALDVSAFSPEELVALIRRTVVDIAGDTETFDLGLGMIFALNLYRKCGQWFGDDGPGLASRMLAGTGGNENAQAGLDLWGLANMAAGEETLRQALLAADSFAWLRSALPQTGVSVEFLAAWDRFMRRHGHHCRGELELMNPRWAETPDYVLRQVQSYLRAIAASDDNFLKRQGLLAERRRQAVAETRRRLRNPLKRMTFNFLLRKAHGCAPMRESIKSEIVRRCAVLRQWLLQLGGQLTAASVFAERDDVFFLRLEELEAVARPHCDREEYRRRVAIRRREYEAHRAVTPPPIVVGRFDAGKAQASSGAAAAPSPDGMLTGVAVNPGVVVGPARVILRAGEDHVLPGEILVAPFTDPGWTPYFLNAAAIVMDIGGILSHGSVVAREFGIPAVVNVGHATRTIRTGQLLEVDGGKGTVRVL